MPISRRRRTIALGASAADAVAIRYAANLAAATHAAAPAARALAGWAREHMPGAFAGLPVEEDPFASSPPLTAAAWHGVRDQLAALAQKHRAADPVARRARRVAALLGLDQADAALLALFAHHAANSAIERLWDSVAAVLRVSQFLHAHAGLLAAFTGLRRAAVASALAPRGGLRQTGLVRLGQQGTIEMMEALQAWLHGHAGPDPRAMLGAPVRRAALALGDFAHLGPDLGHARALLAGALAASRPGTHILLYGPPGTGKTELARTLAAACGARLYELGETDGEGHEPDRRARLGALHLAQRLLGRDPSAGKTVLLLDEAEDVLDSASLMFPFGRLPQPGSRAHLHRLLEASPVPVLWTANSISRFGAPVLRRMTFALETRLPPRSVRATLWQALARRHGVDLPRQECEALAGALPAAPAVAETAISAARLVGGGAESVRRGAAAIVRAMRGHAPPPAASCAPSFDPALIAADTDLAALADQLAAHGDPPACGILLAGPPGTGKSAFARHLADRLGMEPLLLRGSDLLGPYVGQTEANIAQAFQDAAADRQLLIIDEADGLLSDRAQAMRNWEVTQVNELLTWMEAHRLPFVFTTNLSARLDPASLRRFLFRVNFGFLVPAQLAAAWRKFLPGEPPAALLQLDRLTPADFALVAARARLLGAGFGTQAMLAALSDEAEAKRAGPRPIGFAA